MQRLIDANKANEAIKKICDDYGIAYGNKYGGFGDKIASVIDNIPTIDAEPIVYCRECKHLYILNGRYMCKRTAQKIYGLDNYDGLIAVNKNSFCSYGAKMDKK